MRRYLVLGFLALLVLVVALALYATREETRLAQAQEALRDRAVSDAAVVYVEQCAVCHGAQGEGIGATPPLDSDGLRGADYDTLFKVIARGRYNTAMAAWHVDEGGILTSYQIDQLVALIRTVDWGQVRELAARRGMIPAALPVPAVSDAQLAQVAALDPQGAQWAQGLQIFARSCTTCHGANGEGSPLGVALNTPELRAKDAATLERTIREGVPGTMMAPWGKTLTAEEIAALAAFLQHWDELSAAGVALTAPAPAPIDLSDPRAVQELGQRLFTTTCTSCHGENGSGGIGPAINSQQFLSRKDDATIRQAIVAGGWRPNSAMPAFGERLTSVEIDALVQYIRSLAATAPVVANPRGTQQGGGGPPWLRTTPAPGNDQPASGAGSQGQGQRRGRGQGQSGATQVYQGTVVGVAGNTLSFTDSGGASRQAMLGPPWWWSQQTFALSPGDQIELEGFDGGGHMELNWLHNLTTGARLELRTPEGRPVWQP